LTGNLNSRAGCERQHGDNARKEIRRVYRVKINLNAQAGIVFSNPADIQATTRKK
jgi:hypothetical protein